MRHTNKPRTYKVDWSASTVVFEEDEESIIARAQYWADFYSANKDSVNMEMLSKQIANHEVCCVWCFKFLVRSYSPF